MISLEKIASDLGISKGAVSLILNGKARRARISEELETRVKRYCEALNYRPNIHAKRLNSKLVGNIGVLLGRYTGIGSENPFDDYITAKIVGGIAVAAANAGCRFSIQLCSQDSGDDKIFDWFRDREIDGLLYYGFNIPDHWARVFRKESRKVVGIGIAPLEGLGSVNADNWSLAKEQCESLLAQGRRRFVYFGGTEQSHVASERFRGFKSALDEAGVLFRGSDFLKADFSEDLAKKLMLDWMASKDLPEAVVCANGYMAAGAASALGDKRGDKPGKVAVVASDRIPAFAHMEPSIAFFDADPYRQGQLAFSLLMEMLGGASSRNIVIKANAEGNAERASSCDKSSSQARRTP